MRGLRRYYGSLWGVYFHVNAAPASDSCPEPGLSLPRRHGRSLEADLAGAWLTAAGASLQMPTCRRISAISAGRAQKLNLSLMEMKVENFAKVRISPNFSLIRGVAQIGRAHV